MEKEQQYDFMSYGMRKAKEGFTDLEKTAQNILEQYGEQAKMEFEAGVAMAIPQWAAVKHSSSAKDEIQKIEENQERGR